MSKLNQLEIMCTNATSGPWEADNDCDVFSLTTVEVDQRWPEEGKMPKFICSTSYSDEKYDAKFIAECRESMPKLIAVAKAAKALVECRIDNLMAKPRPKVILMEEMQLAMATEKALEALEQE